jgi:formyl-CoA transferase
VVVQEVVWEALATRIGGEALAKDERFATIGERRKNQTIMWGMLNEFGSKHTKREMMAILNEIDVPCGPIMSTEDLANDEHVRGREMYVELDHPKRGKWHNVGMPIKLSNSSVQMERSPLLGEHTDDVLSNVLGMSAEEMARLKEAGAFSR